MRYEAAVSGRRTMEILKKHITFMPFMCAEGERNRPVLSHGPGPGNRPDNESRFTQYRSLGTHRLHACRNLHCFLP